MKINCTIAKAKARKPATLNREILSPASDVSLLNKSITVGETNVAIFVATLIISEKTRTPICGGIVNEMEYIACGIVMLILIPPMKATTNTRASD